jgi:hypothetical protein
MDPAGWSSLEGLLLAGQTLHVKDIEPLLQYRGSWADLALIISSGLEDVWGEIALSVGGIWVHLRTLDKYFPGGQITDEIESWKHVVFRLEKKEFPPDSALKFFSCLTESDRTRELQGQVQELTQRGRINEAFGLCLELADGERLKKILTKGV